MPHHGPEFEVDPTPAGCFVLAALMFALTLAATVTCLVFR